ncbi:DUF4230 domain-containing protein [Rubrivirga sp. S365]|uniref:DUF4230 domain-containing protein n=1 Tax=Rubrivirga litoralis TaxID=3075598 RepID=A0ABU3BNA2_9BACT|nr:MULTISPECIES: DUF4230 domain-containing protein [unclassified Rubrivirga]MDT0630780.1 DUF4230 domain-containing protein [Rubrivirga sp. F394]MDT7856450.1 DUF4230 domain-containing protein [Rubrivirga sp. S365]
MPTDPAAPPARRRLAGFVLGLVIAALVAVVVALGVALGRGGGIDEEEVESAMLSTLQSEASEEFLVTGRLTSSLSGSSARRWRVRLLDIETGRAEVGIRVPATMTYGFSLTDLRPGDIDFQEGGVVEVRLPPLSVFSVEPELEEASVDIDLSGQARLTPSLTERTLEQTLRRVRPALREQAEGHLQTSDQPALNTARTLSRMLSTPLEAAGVDVAGVRFRFVVAPGDTLDVSGEGQRRAVPAETR